MPGIQPIISYPGVTSPESVIATDSHGITPGNFLLNILPQPDIISRQGDLVIGSGDSLRIWRDCIVDAPSVTYDANGLITTLSILDRRWRWSYGRIDGHYNVRDRSGDIVRRFEDESNPHVDTERTPQELAMLLLDAMGELPGTYDVRDLPNEYRPEVYWNAANPAEELASLCDLLGCRICLGADNRVRLKRLNQGALLPVGAVEHQSDLVDPPELPGSLDIVTGPILNQFDFELDAVGLDTDDVIKPIKELSYAPDDGWKSSSPELGFPALDADARPLAMKSVFRWYLLRVPFKHPTIGSIRFRDSIALINQQVELADINNIRSKVLPPIVYGIWWSHDKVKNTGLRAEAQQELLFPPKQRETNDTVIPFGFQVDVDKWLVRFERPVYRIGPLEDVDQPTNELFNFPAVLRLRIAFVMREPNRSFRRMTISRHLSPGPILPILRRDLIPVDIVHFESSVTPDGGKVRLSSNRTDIDREARSLIDSFMDRITTRRASQARYIGIVPTSLDGAIQSVTYTWDASGPRTLIQRNQDTGSSISRPYKLRRASERQRIAARRIEELDGQNQRRRLDLAITE